MNKITSYRQPLTRQRRLLQRGFTLIEILIVMVIIAILASLSAANFQSSQRKARDVRRKNDLHQISNSLETYWNDVRSYPLPTFDSRIAGCDGVGAVCDWGDPFVDDKGTTYMVRLPQDPRHTQGQLYVYLSDGEQYQIYARLENTEDPAVIKVGDTPQVYGTLDCGGLGCNYGISSTNTTPESGNALVAE